MDWTIPADTRIGRVALRVNDRDRMTAFYERVVGLSIQSRDETHAVLGVDGTALLVLTEDAEAPPRQPDEAGLFHTAFRLPSRAALADALHRVEEQHVLDGAADHRVSEALYLSEPEGNGIELYHDRPREAWQEDEDGRVTMPTLQLDLADVREAASGSPDAPTGTTVGHVHLEVSDIDAARRFYVDTLGLAVRQDMGTALFVAAGDYHHHIGLNTWNGRTQPAKGRGGRGLTWYELVLPDDATVETAQTHCHEHGYPVEELDDGFAVTGPDEIRVHVRRPAE